MDIKLERLNETIFHSIFRKWGEGSAKTVIKLLIILSALSLLSAFSYASNFVGSWQVTKVDYSENYLGEIKYPKHFTLFELNGRLSGNYIDQFDFKCDFPLVEEINGGNELLLLNCGTTKHNRAWAPLHKVKVIKGTLVGIVVTNTQQFVWYAEPVK